MCSNPVRIVVLIFMFSSFLNPFWKVSIKFYVTINLHIFVCVQNFVFILYKGKINANMSKKGKIKQWKRHNLNVKNIKNYVKDRKGKYKKVKAFVV